MIPANFETMVDTTQYRQYDQFGPTMFSLSQQSPFHPLPHNHNAAPTHGSATSKRKREEDDSGLSTKKEHLRAMQRRKLESQLVQIQQICFTIDSQYHGWDEFDLRRSPQAVQRLNVLYRGIVLRQLLNVGALPTSNFSSSEVLSILNTPDLAMFDQLSTQERFDSVHAYLRDRYCYCFWCGTVYDDVDDFQNCHH